VYLIYKGLNNDGSFNYLTCEDGEIQCNSIEEGKQLLLENGVQEDIFNEYSFEELL
jgi:hypothetical protein